MTDDSNFVCIADDSSSVLIYSLKINDSALGKSFVGSDLETQAAKITSTSLVRDSFGIGFKLSWMPHKNVLAVAVPSLTGMTTMFYRKGGKMKSPDGKAIWEEIFLVNAAGAELTHGFEDVNIAVFSPNGHYLATADRKGVVLVWEVIVRKKDTTLKSSDFTPISMFNASPSGPLHDIVWGPKDGDNYIVLASPSASGQIMNVIDISSGRCLPTGEVADVQVQVPVQVQIINDEDSPIIPTSAPQTGSKVDTYALMAAATKNSRENSSTPLPKVTVAQSSSSSPSVGSGSNSGSGSGSGSGKYSRLQKRGSAVADDDDDILDDSADTVQGIQTSAATKADLYDSDTEENIVKIAEDIGADGGVDEEVDEDDDVMVEESADDVIANINRLASGADSVSGMGGVGLAKLQASVAALVAANVKAEKTAVLGPQASFQPACTTFDEKRKRYMVWNSIGNITCMEMGINNRIEIRFTNTQRNKSDAFNDNLNFTMAALSYEGALFSAEPEEDVDEDNLSNLKGSTIYYHAFPGQSLLQGANEVPHTIPHTIPLCLIVHTTAC